MDLYTILPWFRADIRVAAWVKPFASFKPNVNPAYAWEPVLWSSARKRSRTEPTVRDWVAANITFERGTVGAKPDSFWFWLFDLVGAQSGDEFTDLCPGSGAGARCWTSFVTQIAHALEQDSA